MYNYKLIVSYDGGGFRGWQKQGNTDNTIQGKLESIAVSLADLLECGGAPIDVNGAGRTDAGVHALGQTANFKIKNFAEPDFVKDFFNKYLPEAVRVTRVSIEEERFHARLSAVGKTYVYNVFCGEEMDVFLRKYAYFFNIKEKCFDAEKLEAAAQKLAGVHDFTGFCTKAPKNKSAVREIFSVQVKKSEAIKGLLSIEFYGNGFLYNQVRIMAGTLLEIAAGEKTADDIDVILETKDRGKAGFTAPPCGLILYSVDY